MRKAILVVICWAICVCTVAAVDQVPLDVKTGLWQVDMTLNYTGLPPQFQAMLDRMTPEQRAAAGYGAKHTYKICVGENMRTQPWTKDDKNCQWTILKSSSSELDVHGISCRMGKNEGLNTEVTYKIHASDSEHVEATIHGTGTGNGINAKLDGTYSGKFISGACPK